jgi:hypothetical protein
VTDTPEITRNDGAGRFETTVDGIRAELTFRLDGNRIILDHTGVPDAIAGHGIAGDLARAAFGYAAAEDLTIVPRCPYVRAWMDRHPDEVEKVTIEAV